MAILWASRAFEIDRGSPFFGFDVGRPWKTDLGPIRGPSWGPLGLILGASGANLGAILGHLGPFFKLAWVPWAYLGAFFGDLGPSWRYVWRS